MNKITIGGVDFEFPKGYKVDTSAIMRARFFFEVVHQPQKYLGKIKDWPEAAKWALSEHIQGFIKEDWHGTLARKNKVSRELP